MVTALIGTLVVMGLYCCYVANKCHELSLRMKSGNAFALQVLQEREMVQDFVAGLLRVVNEEAGGIGKRLDESAEIINTIQLHAPELLVRNRALTYWLRANDEFLCALADAASGGTDCEQRQRIANENIARRMRVLSQLSTPSPSLPEGTARTSRGEPQGGSAV